MDTNVNLPEGFVLDKQSIQNSSNLPEGFILDEQPITQTPQSPNWLGKGIGLGLGGLGVYGAYRLGKVGMQGATQLSRGILNLPKVVNVQKGANFAQQIRKAFIQTHTDKVNQFGAFLNRLAQTNPTRTINLSEFISDIQTDPNISQQAISIFRKTPILDNLLKNPTLAKEVPLQSVQTIINHLETKIPQNIKVNNLDVLDAINTVKGAQLGAFPEMAEIRTNYQTFIEPYKNIKSYFKFNRILNAIKNKFGGAEGEAAAESILPKEVVKKIKGYRAAANLAQMPGETPLMGRWIRSLGSMLVFYPMISQAMRFSQQLEEAKKKGFFTIDQFGNIIPLSKEDLAI